MDVSLLKEKLESKIVSSRVLLSNLKFLNEQVKDTISFTDPINLPFYYHLGKQVDVREVLQIGLKDTAGYIGPCFLQGCKTVDRWIALEKSSEIWLSGLVRSNLKNHMNSGSEAIVLLDPHGLDFWKRKLKDIHWDMAIVSSSCVKDNFVQYLDLAWSNLKDQGLLVVDYISENRPTTSPDLYGAFKKFCRVKNREPVMFETRYGVGIVIR